MTRYTIYTHSKNVLIFSFASWILSNLIFGIILGFNSEPTNAENAIDTVLGLFMNISTIFMLATIFNKLDEEMKEDETHKTE
jgi:hypothetical protein